MDAVRQGSSFPKDLVRSRFEHIPPSCSEEKGHCALGVRLGTSASCEVWGCVPQWRARIKERRPLTSLPFRLIPAFACGLVCVWELCFITDVMVLTNFTSALETNSFFLQHLWCACGFYSSLSFECVCYELGDESLLFRASFQSWVPFVGYPRAVNHFVRYDYNPKWEHRGSVEGWLP